MAVRIVVEIPDEFADHCKSVGDKPRDVILDLIDGLLDLYGDNPYAFDCDDPWRILPDPRQLRLLDPIVDDIDPVQAEPPPPPAMDGRGITGGEGA